MSVREFLDTKVVPAHQRSAQEERAQAIEFIRFVATTLRMTKAMKEKPQAVLLWIAEEIENGEHWR